MSTDQDRTMAAAGAILVYGLVIGGLDNLVRLIAADSGLWQFHATRGAIALPVLVVLTWAFGMRLVPVNLTAVVARSLIHGVAMLIYFGALAFLPVAQVAAGLFTAPIFVLLINFLVYGRPISGLQSLAVAIGFVGVVLVLGPEALQGATTASLLPVAAGAMYAMGNIATREWCSQETAGTLLFGFFTALALFGVIGMGALALYPIATPAGADGFVLRGYAAPSQTFWIVITVQAIGSVFAVGLMIRAYQIASAARASVFEYVLLPTSALWGWVIWGEVPTLLAVVGMALIASAGVLIASTATPQTVPSPTA
jgi:drug/metabolite transporter (DMT)-like permease